MRYGVYVNKELVASMNHLESAEALAQDIQTTFGESCEVVVFDAAAREWL